MSVFSGFGTAAVHADEQTEGVQRSDWITFCTFWSAQPPSPEPNQTNPNQNPWNEFCSRLCDYYMNNDFIDPEDEENRSAWESFCDSIKDNDYSISNWKDMWLGFIDTPYVVKFKNFEESLKKREVDEPLYTDSKYESLAKTWVNFCDYWSKQPESPNDAEWECFCNNLAGYPQFTLEDENYNAVKSKWSGLCHELRAYGDWQDKWEDMWITFKNKFSAFKDCLICIKWDEFWHAMSEVPLYTDSRNLINIWNLKEGDEVGSEYGFYTLPVDIQATGIFSVVSGGYCGYNRDLITVYNLIEIENETAEGATGVGGSINEDTFVIEATTEFLKVNKDVSMGTLPTAGTKIDGKIVSTLENGCISLSEEDTSITINATQRCYRYNDTVISNTLYKHGAHKVEGWLSLTEDCMFRVKSAKKIYVDIDGCGSEEIVNHIILKRYDDTSETDKKKDDDAKDTYYTLPVATIVKHPSESDSDTNTDDVETDSEEKNDSKSGLYTSAEEKVIKETEKAAEKVFGSEINIGITFSDTDDAVTGTKNSENKYVDSDGKILKNTFVQNKKGILFVDENGSPLKKSLVVVVDADTNEKKEYFTNNYGYPVKDAIIRLENGKKIYVGEDGVLVKNAMIEKNGKTYIIDKNGFIVTNKVVKFEGKKYYVNAKGVIVKNRLVTDNKGKKHYATETGAFATSTWIQIKGNKYYFTKYSNLKTIKPLKKTK